MEKDPTYEVPWKEELAANLRGFALVARSAPSLTLGMLLIALVTGLVPAFVVKKTGTLIDSVRPTLVQGLDSIPGRTARDALIAMSIAIILTQLAAPVRTSLDFGLRHRFQAYLARRMMRGISDLPGLAYFEDPSFRDKLEVTQWIGWAPAQSASQSISAVQNVISFVAMAYLAASYAPWAPLVIALGVLPGGIAAWHFTTVTGMVQWRYSSQIRKSNYYKALALNKDPAKEMRISALKDWTIGRQTEHWLAGKTEVWKKQRRTLILALILQILATVVVAFVFIGALNATLDGKLGIGKFTVAMGGIVGSMTALFAIFQSAAWIRRGNYWLPNALRILSLATTAPRLDVAGLQRARPQGQEPAGIKFEGVSFAYQGTDRLILNDLNLFISAGTSLALVGENGAGKTTLIKLLCRFYDPTVGRILIDGVDIKQFELADLRTRLGVIFQDFVRYSLPASDNVGFGAVKSLQQRDLLVEAARRVGVLEKIDTLPEGWDTPLSREFGGVDLSGGEWQRIALARAMMAQVGGDSDILVLDEPTASLDVRLEHELYEHFAELSLGKTTLLVSHRFSTVRMAERIVFMQDGQVVEDGTHEDLIAQAGRYAEMYEIQASHYRLTGALD